MSTCEALSAKGQHLFVAYSVRGVAGECCYFCGEKGCTA